MARAHWHMQCQFQRCDCSQSRSSLLPITGTSHDFLNIHPKLTWHHAPYPQGGAGKHNKGHSAAASAVCATLCQQRWRASAQAATCVYASTHACREAQHTHTTIHNHSLVMLDDDPSTNTPIKGNITSACHMGCVCESTSGRGWH